MKDILKRYRLFLSLVAINASVGLAFPEIGLKSLSITKNNLIEMMSVIPPIFILLGLLDVWVDRATMIKYTGKGSGLKGVLIAFLLGSASAGPLYAAFPVAGVMLKKGSSLFNVFIFIGAWSTTKIPMLTFEAANLGLSFTLTRLALSIIGIVLIAFTTEKSLNKQQQADIYELNR
ncbi:MAG: permease [Clostridiales bacterium]|nr:permease [Clostridiales bacterium]